MYKIYLMKNLLTYHFYNFGDLTRISFPLHIDEKVTAYQEISHYKNSGVSFYYKNKYTG